MTDDVLPDDEREQERTGQWDAILFDIGGTLVDEAPPATAVDDLRVVLLPGVVEDLRRMAATTRLGAVTNTAVMTEADVRRLLAPSGLDDLLEVVVTSHDVGVEKPDPWPILVALERMDLTRPARVLYVGDRPTDEQAALAAGVRFAHADGRTRLAEVVAGASPPTPR